MGWSLDTRKGSKEGNEDAQMRIEKQPWMTQKITETHTLLVGCPKSEGRLLTGKGVWTEL